MAATSAAANAPGNGRWAPRAIAATAIITVSASGDDLVINGLANAMRITNTDLTDDIVVRGGNIEELGACDKTEMNAGDVFVIETPGGGGFGSPKPEG